MFLFLIYINIQKYIRKHSLNPSANVSLQILLLLSPAIFAELLRINDPNDEPFLPIYPTYPYNPKLIKRGAERELVPQLTPNESYEAPKEDARDSYSTSYSSNYQRDSYYPNYNPYPKNISPSPTYNPYYNQNPYAYTNSPYATYNPYPTSYAVSMSPATYPASSYPDYYYQPPYYYPHYFNHALFPPPPPPPTSPPPQPSESVDYHETSQDSTEAEDDKQDKDKKSKNPKEDETNQDVSASQYVDGGNYISGNSKDLDGQSSSYKIANPYNQLEQDVPTKNPLIPLPKTTYRVISVAGQPVGPDYPLPAQYLKAQQIEQLMSQTLATLLAQNTQQQTNQPESNKDTVSAVNDGSYVNQDTYNPSVQSYVVVPAVPNVRTKTGVTYVINTGDIAKVNEEQVNTQVVPSHTASSKTAKYSGNLYVRKPATQAILEQPQTTLDLSQVTYVPRQGNHNRGRVTADNRPADQVSKYESYDAMQTYTVTPSPSDNKREQQTQGNYQRQAGTYRSKDFVAAPQTPQTYTYQFSAYESDQATTAQQPLQDNVNPDDGDFGAKQFSKGWHGDSWGEPVCDIRR